MVFFIVTATVNLIAQGFTRQSYHDAEKKNLKEVYQVKDTLRNVVHGRYTSYYLNGNIESKGEFTNDETTGVWEFYYETGNVKMRGMLLKAPAMAFGNIFLKKARKVWKD